MFGIPTWLIGLIGGFVALLAVGASEYVLYSKWQLAQANLNTQTKNVDTLKAAYNGAVQTNKSLNDQVAKLIQDKQYDENLLIVQHDAIITLQRNADDRKTQVSKQPSGAASPALICAITGVCPQTGIASTDH